MITVTISLNAMCPKLSKHHSANGERTHGHGKYHARARIIAG